MTIGMFYETPNGNIVYAYGVKEKLVLYINENNEQKTMNYSDFTLWNKKREDLKDFPNPSPYSSLPYSFDLNYDTNNLSDLNYKISQNFFDKEDINYILNLCEINENNMWDGYHREYIKESILETLYEYDIDFDGKENIELDLN